MTASDPSPPDGAEPGTAGDRRSSSRIRIAAIAVLVVVVIGAIGAWRWRADRAYIGTETAAELTWGMCTNGIGWEDPATGVGWWGGNEIVTTGDYESEPRQFVLGAATPTEGRPMSYVTRHSTGTVRFDSYDRATFTSRTGGTLELARTSDGQSYEAHCVNQDIYGPGQVAAPAHYGVALQGVLGRAASSPDEPNLLATGTVRVLVDGAVVAETPVATGEFVVYVPVLGTMTVEGDLGDGACATDTRTIVSGVPDPYVLLCDQAAP